MPAPRSRRAPRRARGPLPAARGKCPLSPSLAPPPFTYVSARPLARSSVRSRVRPAPAHRPPPPDSVTASFTRQVSLCACSALSPVRCSQLPTVAARHSRGLQLPTPPPSMCSSGLRQAGRRGAVVPWGCGAGRVWCSASISAPSQFGPRPESAPTAPAQQPTAASTCRRAVASPAWRSSHLLPGQLEADPEPAAAALRGPGGLPARPPLRCGGLRGPHTCLLGPLPQESHLRPRGMPGMQGSSRRAGVSLGGTCGGPRVEGVGGDADTALCTWPGAPALPRPAALAARAAIRFLWSHNDSPAGSNECLWKEGHRQQRRHLGPEVIGARPGELCAWPPTPARARAGCVLGPRCGRLVPWGSCPRGFGAECPAPTEAACAGRVGTATRGVRPAQEAGRRLLWGGVGRPVAGLCPCGSEGHRVR